MSNRSYLNQRITRDFLCVMTILAHKGHTQTHRDAHTSFGFTLEMLLLHVCVCVLMFVFAWVLGKCSTTTTRVQSKCQI